MQRTLHCEITGWGTFLPDTPEEVHRFGDQTRYRVSPDRTQLEVLSTAASAALERAQLTIGEIDTVVNASAVGIQPIPSTAAILLGELDPNRDSSAGAYDVNSTCTSFLTALVDAARQIELGEKERVLVVSGEVGSRGLNPKQKESFELFSDAGAAVVVSATEHANKGVLGHAMQTYPQFARAAEIRGGLSALPPEHYPRNPEEYLFDMNGKAVFRATQNVLPQFFDDFSERAGFTLGDFDYIVPHQASRALGLIMRRLGVDPEKYADIVTSHGNMISASVPYAFIHSIENGAVTPGSKVLLCGTAAGLTINAVALQM